MTWKKAVDDKTNTENEEPSGNAMYRLRRDKIRDDGVSNCDVVSFDTSKWSNALWTESIKAINKVKNTTIDFILNI